LRGYRSLTHGDKPDTIESKSHQEDLDHIKSILKQLSGDSIEPRQVCIAARTNDDVDVITEGLKRAGMPTLRLERVNV
jgi:superfamily I DNA/RNA helicase